MLKMNVEIDQRLYGNLSAKDGDVLVGKTNTTLSAGVEKRLTSRFTRDRHCLVLSILRAG